MKTKMGNVKVYKNIKEAIKATKKDLENFHIVNAGKTN